jgi:hypothetical protein
MADLTGFDANQVQPSKPFEPIPAGQYLAEIIASDWRRNKKNTGDFLELCFEIVEGAYAGRRLWRYLNLVHQNPKAVEISKAELSSICWTLGVMTPGDSTALHDLPLLVHVRCKRRADTGELINEIFAYAKKDSSAPPPTDPPADQQPPPGPPSLPAGLPPLPPGSVPPWRAS